MIITSNNIFRTSETLNIRIKAIEQRIKKLEQDKIEDNFSNAKERELKGLYTKLQPLSNRLSEIHQLILDYSARIPSDGERYIVIEYFVNHSTQSSIVNEDFYERTWVYRIIKKYQNM